MVKVKYPVVRGADGVLYSVAEYEDVVKPLWKEMMYKESKL